jgi:alpha-amylase
MFGIEATGVWLAERVWEPHLARPIAQAGGRYTILDDTHFESVGLDREKDLFGYYATEEEGYPLAVFPTHTYLRYAIPWQPIDTLIDWLHVQADQPLASFQPKLALIGDDGEKFGTWPGTFERCWGEGKYMEALFTTLEKNAEWLQTIVPGEFTADYPPLGRIYLPAASYHEMDEWSLPPDVSHQLISLRRTLDAENRPDIVRFMNAGLWRNFMVKYDEINHMHKRMLMVSQKVHNMRRGRKREQALDLLWASQSNDPYWHGLFGGVYLFNFRVANYANLIAAESAADGDDMPLFLTRGDFDRDNREDVVVTGSPLTVVWNPSQGGALLELDFRPANYNLSNVMTRRKEGYHADLIAAVGDNTIVTPMSPQATELDNTANPAIRAKEVGLEHYLIYDWHRRASFVDHFIAPSTTLDEFYRAQYAEQGDFVNQPYEIVDTFCDGAAATVHLCREGHVWLGEVLQPLTVHKVFSLVSDDAVLRVVYTLTHDSSTPFDARFGIETVVGFDGGQDLSYCSLRINDSYHRRSLADLREMEAVSSIATDSNLRNLTLWTTLSRPAFLWYFPLETITLSEAGFERGYQGTVFLHLWNVRLLPGESWQVTITQSVQQTATRP